MPELRSRFTDFEIVRPVKEDVDNFLPKANFIGQQVFGVERPAIVPVQYEDYTEHMPVGTSRVNVYRLDDLVLGLLRRRALSSMRYEGTFNAAKRRIEESVERIEYPNDMRKRDRKNFHPKLVGIHKRLDQIGIQHDVMPETDIELTMSTVRIIPNPDRLGGRELALVPDPQDKMTVLLIEQAEACFSALVNHACKAVYPASSEPIEVPFARMPVDATSNQIVDIVGRIDALLPVQLVLDGGGVDIANVQRSGNGS